MLGRHLAGYAVRSPLIIAIARGGLPVAAAVAEELEADLDVVVIQKLGVPGHPHITAGALSSRGASSINHRALGAFGVSPIALDRALDKERLALEQQEREIRGNRPAREISGRLVILVDDAVMTGTTLHTAIVTLRLAGAAAVVLATPAADEPALAGLRREADAVVCPERRGRLDTLSEVYENAEIVSLDEARRILAQARSS